MMGQMKERMTEQMKKLIMALAVVFVGVLGFPVQAYANPIEVNANTTQWQDGNTYNVGDGHNITINERIVVHGSVTLNLGENTTLTAAKGISAQDKSSLTINGSGTLIAYGADHCAAIGGASEIDSGDIIINGGTILAYGGSEAAGIGGGYKADSVGRIEINGGNVTAWSGLGAAGIGGGCKGTNKKITITGGVVNAYGWAGGAGIGSGSQKDNGIIEIIGKEGSDRDACQVNASVRDYRNYCGAAGIGCGDSANCTNNITIKNATVKAISTSGLGSSDFGGAGIGAGSSSQTFGVAGDMKATITIENADVASTGGHEGGAGIGAGFGGDMSGTVRIQNSSVKAGGGLGAAGIGGGRERARTRYGGAGGTVYIEGDSDVTAIGGRIWDQPGLRCSAIGHGANEKETGHVYIDDGLMVDAGDDPNALEDRRFTAFEREGACLHRFAAHIYPCIIHDLDKTYSNITKDTHTQDTCEYCGKKFKAEPHEKNDYNQCVKCGYQGELYTVTYSCGDNTVQQIVVPGYPIQLPFPDDLFEAPSDYAFTGNWEIGDQSYPAGGRFMIKGSLKAKAQVVKSYPLWVDGVQVNMANYGDIMGDGDNPTVKYDDNNHTLTLNGARITGRNKIDGSNSYAGIYSQLDNLTIVVNNENYVSPESGKKEDLVYGIYATGNLTINGSANSSLSVKGVYRGIQSSKTVDTSVVDVTVTAEPDVKSETGVTMDTVGIDAQNIKIQSGNLKAVGNTAVRYTGTFTMGDSLGIEEPMGAKPEANTIIYDGVNADGTTARKTAERVVVSKSTNYQLWVGGTAVNSQNQDKLLNGAASFNPATKTLTFSKSNTFSDVPAVDLELYNETKTTGETTSKITVKALVCSALDELTIVAPSNGLALSSANVDYGIYTFGDLTFKGGDIKITAKNTAIYSYGDITAEKCSLDVVAENASGGTDYLIYSAGDITVGDIDIDGVVGSTPGNLKGLSMNGTGVYAFGDIVILGDVALAANAGTLLESKDGSIVIGGSVSTKYPASGDSSSTINSTEVGFKASEDIFMSKEYGTDIKWEINTRTSGIAMKAFDIIIPPTYGIREDRESGGKCKISYESTATVIRNESNAEVGNIVIFEDATILPKAVPNLTYNGDEQELVTAGSPSYGSVLYAVGDKETTPDDSKFKDEIPARTDAGTYYVWYKMTGEGLYNETGYVETKIEKIDYDETQEIFITVGVNEDTVVDLPEGETYNGGSINIEESAASLISNPKVENNVLKFKASSSGSAKIKIPVTSANYNYVVVNVTIKETPVAKVTITKKNDPNNDPINGNVMSVLYGDSFTLVSSVGNGGDSASGWSWKSEGEGEQIVNLNPTSGSNECTVSIVGVGTTKITAAYSYNNTYGEATITLTAKKKPLTVTWGEETCFTYDGGAQIPDVTVTGLVDGDNESGAYSVKGEAADVGDYTAEVSLSDTASKKYQLPANYKCSFTIGKMPIIGAQITLGDSLTYDGSVKTQNVSKVELVVDNDNNKTVMIAPDNYDIYGNQGTDAGTYELTVTAKKDSNYSGSATKTFTIAKKSVVPEVTFVNGNSYAYTGSAITPTYTVKNGNTALATSDYTASIEDNINAGEGKLTIAAAAGGNYSFDPVTVSFTIAKAAHEEVQAGGELKYGLSGTVALASYIEAGGSMGTISISDASSVLSGTPSISGTTLSYSFADNAENAGKTAVVTVPVKDCTNYADYSILVTLTVTDCAPDNHAYDSGVITKQPTIFEEGVRTYTCTRCHHTYTETVPKVDDGEDHSDLIEDITDEEGKTKAEVKTEDKEDGSKETTVTVGGQEVEKTVTDADGNETVETHIWIGGLKSSYTYTGSAIKPSFHVYDGTKKLSSGTDYSVSYKNNKNAGDTATIMISFKGNYKGTAQEKLSFSITPAVLGADVEATDVTTYATGKTLKPVPTMKWVSTGKSIDKKNFTFAYKDAAGNDITGIKEAGQYKLVITSKNGSFTGETEAAITVTGSKKLLLSGATVKLSPNKYTYTGDPIIPASGTYTLKLNGKILTEGTDYYVSDIRNNIEHGKATIVFTAKDGNQAGYVGEKSATFTISKGRELKEGDGFTYSYNTSVPYAKGGAKPTVVVKDGDDTLKAGTDYTVSYSKNTKVTNGATAVITIKGKGNYKGSVKKYFTITKQDISKLAGNIITADKVESKKGYKNPTVTITDLDGKKLKAGTDFAIISDSYSGPDTNGVVTATVSGKGNYTGTANITYRYIKGAQQLGKVKVMKSLASKTYTGREVRLTNADLTGILYTGSKSSPVYLTPGTDFKVVSYTNNTKTGTAKVTIQGIGAYGGTRTLSFKIIAKKGDYKGALVGGEWTKVQ